MVDFGKLSIIIKREFLTRIRTKAFIITTILVPIGLAAIFFVPILIQMMDSDTKHEIAVVDHTNIVYPKLAEIDSVHYQDYRERDIKELRQMVMDGDIEGFVTIDDENIQQNKSLELIYGGGGGISLMRSVENDFQSVFRDVRLRRAEASDEIMSILETETRVNRTKLTEEGTEESANTFFLSGLGYVMAFIVYGAIFGYGGYVMRSVVEEKTSRIVEVVVSSAKPFELLLGKVLGIGALALTQCLIWVLTGAGLLAVSGPIVSMFTNTSDTANVAETAAASGMPEIPAIDPSIGIYFVIFFVMGYMIYSAVLAAIGAAVDSESDTQQLMIPVMIPMIIAIIILPRVAIDPDSTFSIISSLIPFFSPVLMIARIPITDVPFWEIGLSILLLIGTFVGLMWLSSKIYRVGILNYGKSANFKELMKWIRRG